MLTWQEIFSLRRMLKVLMVKRAAKKGEIKRNTKANHAKEIKWRRNDEPQGLQGQR
jgi:hypothetical protein